MILGNGTVVTITIPKPTFTYAKPSGPDVLVLPVAGPQGPAFDFDIDTHGNAIIDGGGPNNGTGA